MNWCPKLFVLYVLNCTVSKLHFGDSSLFPSQKLLLLRQTTGQQQRKKDKNKKSNTGNQRQNAHKECWVRLMKINNLHPIIYSK